MDLTDTLEAVCFYSERRMYTDSLSIKTNAVLPIFYGLDWDLLDPVVVQTNVEWDQTSYDYCLFTNNQPTPMVLVRVYNDTGHQTNLVWTHNDAGPHMDPTNDDARRDQSHDDAGPDTDHTGVPFLLLVDPSTIELMFTDADTPNKTPATLFRTSLDDIINHEGRLRRYLDATAVSSGDAIEHAREDLRAREELSGALLRGLELLVDRRDDTLFYRLIEAAEEAAGFAPNEEYTLHILQDWCRALSRRDGERLEILPEAIQETDGPPPSDNESATSRWSLQSEPTVPMTMTPKATKSTREPTASDDDDRVPDTRRRWASPTRETGHRQATVTLSGTITHHATAIDAYVYTFRRLARRDPTFLERLSKRPEMHRRKRNYLGHTPAELYPRSPNLRHRYNNVSSGWVIANNINNELKLRNLRVAAEVAGLAWGTELIVEFQSPHGDDGAHRRRE